MRWGQLEGDSTLLSLYSQGLGLPAGYEFVDVPSLELPVLDAILGEGAIRTARAIIVVAPTGFLNKLPLEPATAGTSPSMVFIKQTIENSCGAIALLHTLCNLTGVESELIESLLSAGDGESRARLIESNQELATMHSSFVQMGATEIPNSDDDTDLHFVAIMPQQGATKPVLLDGRRGGPLVISSELRGDFVESTLDALQNICRGDDEQVAHMAVFALLGQTQ